MSDPGRTARSTRRALVAVVVGAQLLAACAGPGVPASREPIPSGAVTISATEYAFAPASASVPAGSITFAVTNAGTENHEFEVLQGETSVGRIDQLTRQTTQVLTVTLAAGNYTFACRLNGHDQLGMTGTLTVTGS